MKPAQDSKVMKGIRRKMIELNLDERPAVSQTENIGKMFRKLHPVHCGERIEKKLEGRQERVQKGFYMLWEPLKFHLCVIRSSIEDGP